MFREHIPVYIAAQDARPVPPARAVLRAWRPDRRARGLLPVLARRRFWDLQRRLSGLLRLGNRASAKRSPTSWALRPPPRGRSVSADRRLCHRAAAAPRRQAGLGADEAERARRSDARVAARGWSRSWPPRSGATESATSSSMRSATAPARSSMPTSCRCSPQTRRRHASLVVQSLHLLRARRHHGAVQEAALTRLIGSGKPITRLTIYTMSDALEQADPSMSPYGKSLLYLVSDAFEDAVPTPHRRASEEPEVRSRAHPLLRPRADREGRRHRLLEDAAGAPLDARTQSITHGGFDNDVATMTSVMRRVLGVPTGRDRRLLRGARPTSTGRAMAARAAAAAAPARRGPRLRRAPAAPRRPRRRRRSGR